jgi:hypothetical protein
MRQHFKSYWFWLYLTIALYSVHDFFDHILREDGLYFSDHWVQWLEFTISCTAVVCICIYYFNLLLKKVFRKETLVSQSLAIILAMLVHLYVSGRIFDLLIFGHQTLVFRFNLPILLIVLGAFYFIRIVHYLVLKISTKKIR